MQQFGFLVRQYYRHIRHYQTYYKHHLTWCLWYFVLAAPPPSAAAATPALKMFTLHEPQKKMARSPVNLSSGLQKCREILKYQHSISQYFVGERKSLRGPEPGGPTVSRHGELF